VEAAAEYLATRLSDGGKGRLATYREEVVAASTLRECSVHFTVINQRRHRILWREAAELLKMGVNLSYQATKFPSCNTLGSESEGVKDLGGKAESMTEGQAAKSDRSRSVSKGSIRKRGREPSRIGKTPRF